MAETTDQGSANDPAFARILWLALIANWVMFAVEGTPALWPDHRPCKRMPSIFSPTARLML